MIMLPRSYLRLVGLGLLGLALLQTLAACGHVPVSTIYKLRKFDPTTFDPGELRVAVQMSDVIRDRAGATRLELRVSLKGGNPEDRHYSFILEQVLDLADSVLVAAAKPRMVIRAYRLSAADAQRVRAIQKEALAARGSGHGQNRIELKVASGGCRTDALPAGPLLTNTFIRTGDSEGYIVLLKDVDLRTAIPAGRSIDDELPPCGQAG